MEVHDLACGNQERPAWTTAVGCGQNWCPSVSRLSGDVRKDHVFRVVPRVLIEGTAARGEPSNTSAQRTR